MNIQFLGAAHTVTGSFFLISTETTKIAIDCGLFQGSKAVKERNYGEFAVNPVSIDHLILSHAHIDHIGLIPKLCAKGFNGTIYCSSATKELAGILLPDSAHIQETEVERKNRKLIRAGQQLLKPIYTIDDALKSLEKFQEVNMDEVIRLTPDLEFCLRDAGHILGSCIIELWIKEQGVKTKFVFSGDLGNIDQPIINDPTFVKEADYLIMESTYGNRFHGPIENRTDDLQRIIEEAMSNGGNLIIPAFAVERTQDLLYDLVVLKQQGKLSENINIYVDSPLAIAATEIFINSSDYFDEETKKLFSVDKQLFKSLNLNYSRSVEDSIRLNNSKGNNIIISASGMCDAGRIKHHLKNNLWRKECTVLFVGYQAEGTLGRRILEGEKRVTIHGEKVVVNAAIKSIPSYSAHADRAGLMTWLQGFEKKPQIVFLVHGEEEALHSLAELIELEQNIKVIVPNMLEEYQLLPGIVVSEQIEEIQAEVVPPFKNMLQAQESYLNMQLIVNEIVQQLMQEHRYDNIIDLADKINQIVKAARVEQI